MSETGAVRRHPTDVPRSRVMQEHSTSYRQSAMTAFHLTEEDLAANRTGRLSSLQSQRMLRSGMWNVVGAVAGAVVLALIVLAVAHKPLKPVQWIISIVLAGALIVTGVVMNARLRRSVAEGVVERHAGSISVVRRGKAGFFITVNGASFRLPVQPMTVRNGAPYALYVMPAAKRIIAMEPLDE
jgi:hypothetical protein